MQYPRLLGSAPDENRTRPIGQPGRFETVVPDVDRVAEIGQSCADETFRVFQAIHPEVEVLTTDMTKAVDAMARRARAAR